MVRRRSRDLTVAVTGANGALGRGIVRRLLDEPSVHHVIAIDVTAADPPPPATLRRADVRDPLLDQALDGVDVVVHVAGLHRPEVSAAERRAVNVHGTENVLSAAVVAGVRSVVLVTSAMVYGALPDNPVPLTEETPLRALRDDSLVGDFVAVERLAESCRATHSSTDVVVLRPATLVGPGADSVLTRHFEAPRLLVVRGTAPLWQFCHITDLEAACVLAARGELTGAVNVAPDGWLTQADVEQISGLRRLELPATLAFAAAERLHRAKVTPAPANELSYLQHPWVVANDRLIQAGWKPAFDNTEALRAQLALASDHITLAARRVRRDDATRAAAGATVALLGTAALVRARRRRR